MGGGTSDQRTVFFLLIYEYIHNSNIIYIFAHISDFQVVIKAYWINNLINLIMNSFALFGCSYLTKATVCYRLCSRSTLKTRITEHTSGSCEAGMCRNLWNRRLVWGAAGHV